MVVALSFGLECMALVFIIFMRLGHFQYLTDISCLYFLSVSIFICVLNPQWVLATLRTQVKLAVANLSGIHLAAIRSHDGFYANCAVHRQTCVALAFN